MKVILVIFFTLLDLMAVVAGLVESANQPEEEACTATAETWQARRVARENHCTRITGLKPRLLRTIGLGAGSGCGNSVTKGLLPTLSARNHSSWPV